MTFTHGGAIYCPECPPIPTKRGERRHELYVLETNYSGCSVDYGACPECGKAWCISYKVDKLERDPDWDVPPLAVQEAEEREYQRTHKQAEIERLKKELEELK